MAVAFLVSDPVSLRERIRAVGEDLATNFGEDNTYLSTATAISDDHDAVIQVSPVNTISVVGKENGAEVILAGINPDTGKQVGVSHLYERRNAVGGHGRVSFILSRNDANLFEELADKNSLVQIYHLLQIKNNTQNNASIFPL